MASQRQIVANRQNGQLGGVRTQDGKAKSRWNAIQHGLLSKEAVIEGALGKENKAEFDFMLSQLHTDLKPVGVLEEMLVERIAILYWKSKRVQRIENLSFMHLIDAENKRYKSVSKEFEPETLCAECYEKDRDTSPMEADWWTVQKHFAPIERREQEIIEAAASLASSDSIDRLNRYSTTVERQLFRAIHELERLQRLRKGDAVPAPVVMDLALHTSEQVTSP